MIHLNLTQAYPASSEIDGKSHNRGVVLELELKTPTTTQDVRIELREDLLRRLFLNLEDALKR